MASIHQYSNEYTLQCILGRAGGHGGKTPLEPSSGRPFSTFTIYAYNNDRITG
jgi:hypothetical protein